MIGCSRRRSSSEGSDGEMWENNALRKLGDGQWERSKKSPAEVQTRRTSKDGVVVSEEEVGKDGMEWEFF